MLTRDSAPAAQWLLPVYLVNASLVLCHEVDAAYWHEWRLFHLPGGPDGFVAIHLVVVPLILVGLVMVARNAVRARLWSVAIGISGAAGSAIHLAFIARGDESFATPFSLALIIAFGLSSAVLTAAAIALRDHAGRMPSGEKSGRRLCGD